MRKYAEEGRSKKLLKKNEPRSGQNCKSEKDIKKLAIVTYKKWKNWTEGKSCVRMNFLDKNYGKASSL